MSFMEEMMKINGEVKEQFDLFTDALKRQGKLDDVTLTTKADRAKVDVEGTDSPS